MTPYSKRKFGRVDLEVTALALGTSAIGNSFKHTDEETSDAMFQTAWDLGVRLFDTAPMYGHGLSELRTGHSLRWKNRDEFVLSTKVGRVLKAKPRTQIDFGMWNNAAPNEMIFDYSYDGTMRSIEDSLQRLALERLDICFIHDIDVFTRGNDQPEVFKEAMNGAWRALESLRDQGVVKAIGVGVNEWQVCHQALQQRDFDCFLLAGRYTLLEQDSLDKFLPLCLERGAAVMLGGGFNSGILATGAIENARYNYAPAPATVLSKVAAIEKICRDYEVPLPAAAMQFVTAHPAITSFVAGTRTVDQLQKNVDWFSYPIPADLWADLKKAGLIRADAPTSQG